MEARYKCPRAERRKEEREPARNAACSFQFSVWSHVTRVVSAARTNVLYASVTLPPRRGESVFQLNGSCADQIQSQFNLFLASAYFVLSERKTISAPVWTGPACGGGPQTHATTSAFLSPTNRGYSTIQFDTFALTRDDGTAPESGMLSFADPITFEMSISNNVAGKYIGWWIATDGGVRVDEPHPQQTVAVTLPFEMRAYNVALKELCRSQLDTIVQNLSSPVYYVYLGVERLSPDCTLQEGASPRERPRCGDRPAPHHKRRRRPRV